MNMPVLEIIAIVLLTIANGVFAMSELAVVSARRARLEAQADQGSAKARVALSLALNPNDFLSTVQIGITLVGTLAGAFGGATIAARLAAYFDAIPLIAPHGESVALTVVVIAISYLSLVIGELVPKRVALSNPERYAAGLAPLMKRLSTVASPAVRFLTWSTDLLFRMLPVKSEPQQNVTEEEVRRILDQATQSGTFEEAEHEMVEGVFRLGDRRVSELMTPRQDIVWIDLEDPAESVRDTVQQNDYSRFPVASGDLDRLRGFVHVKDVLNELLSGKPFQIESVLKRAPVVPESMRALRLVETLRSSNSHLAFAVNEHGGIEGVVTVTDVLKAIMGEVPGPDGDGEPRALQREDGSWLVDGALPAYELKELLRIKNLPGESSGVFTSVGGFIMTSLGRVPKAGDHFESGEWRFEVLDMDGNRVDKVLVSAAIPPRPAALS